MTILSYSGNDMLKNYYAYCKEKSLHRDIQDKWPPVCAKVRDVATHNRFYFTLSRKNVMKVDIGKWSFNWVNAEAGQTMSLLMGLQDVGSIPVCSKRLAFLNNGVKKFSTLCESEMAFITDFISTLVWLVPKSNTSNSGNASFYELPHMTFVSDATLFFIPPFHQVPREYGFLGFVENLYHEALHHQVHTFNAFHSNKYCHGALGDLLIDFPQRQDRTFSYTQALNACYVYGEIIEYRSKIAKSLSENHQLKDLIWINEALNYAIIMRSNLVASLYDVKDAFCSPWKFLIEGWFSEQE